MVALIAEATSILTKKERKSGKQTDFQGHLTIKNVEQRKIATILGHTELRSTMRYQHLSIDHLRGH